MNKNKIMKYGATTHNRTVYASGAVAPSGYEKPQSACGLCAVFLRHIFAVAGMLRIPLSQPQKRHIQPERYVPFFLNFQKSETPPSLAAQRWFIILNNALSLKYQILLF
jgi:hypothetical protein